MQGNVFECFGIVFAKFTLWGQGVFGAREWAPSLFLFACVASGTFLEYSRLHLLILRSAIAIFRAYSKPCESVESGSSGSSLHS